LKFVFAPEERDVYRKQPPFKNLAPLGAKSIGRQSIGEKPKTLRSAGAPVERAASSYSHLRPYRAKESNNLLSHFEVESANFRFVAHADIGRLALLLPTAAEGFV